MQDFTIKVKNKKQTKLTAIRKKTTKTLQGMQYLVLISFVLLGVSLVDGYVTRNESGVEWHYGTSDVRSIQQDYLDPQELIKAVQMSKPSEALQARGGAKHDVQDDHSYYLELIKKYFPEAPHIMVAIAKEESQLDPNAVNYNCRYKISSKGATQTTVYDSLTHVYIDIAVVSKERISGYVSTWCRPGHSRFAWSKDSGLFGINSVHTTERLSPEEQVKLARSIYDTYGLTAWVSYKTGRYLKHL